MALGTPTRLTDGLGGTVLDDGDEAVLWIHGYTLDSTIWEEPWRHLPGWRHIGVDLPGHGSSEPMRAGATMPELARRLCDVALERRVRHLVGLSFGGMVALQMAIEAPRAFTTVTLSSPAVGGAGNDPRAQSRHRELMSLCRERGPGPWMTALWMTWPPDIFRGASAHPALWRTLEAAIDRHTWAEMRDPRLLSVTNHPGQIHDLERIRASVLVLVGEHDMPAFKSSAELLRRGVSRCRRVACAGAGHLCLLEAPEAMAGLVGAHLRSSHEVRPEHTPASVATNARAAAGATHRELDPDRGP
jgi:pimeloyl-ACP methyl ester carboxylesterase